MAVVERWTLWGGRGVTRPIFLEGVQHGYCAKFVVAVSYNVNPIRYTEYAEILEVLIQKGSAAV